MKLSALNRFGLEPPEPEHKQNDVNAYIYSGDSEIRPAPYPPSTKFAQPEYLLFHLMGGEDLHTVQILVLFYAFLFALSCNCSLIMVLSKGSSGTSFMSHVMRKLS